MDLSAEILALDDLRTKKVKVPVWKREVTIREMGLHESLAAFGPDRMSKDGKVTLTSEDIARVVASAVIDPDSGEPVFSADQVPALAKKNRTALMYIYNQVIALGGSPEEAEGN